MDIQKNVVNLLFETNLNDKIMKKYILSLILSVAAGIVGTAQTASDLLVEMPVAPESITRLDERCNYIISRYWDKFNPKSSFSSLDRMDKTFGQFVALTPYATADTVHLAVDHLISVVQKAQPENLITLAKIAEKWCYIDTAEYLSEELYFPFIEAIVKNKKAKGAERARFQAQYNQLLNSRVGCKVQSLTYTKPDGTKGSIDDVAAPHVLLFFYDPECTDCRFAKTRLEADYSVKKLIDDNELAVMAIYPGDADDAWRTDAEQLPQSWIVGANPDVDQTFTMRYKPEIYYLDKARTIRVKDVPIDNILTTFNQFIQYKSLKGE
jgi:hypothetical protein